MGQKARGFARATSVRSDVDRSEEDCGRFSRRLLALALAGAVLRVAYLLSQQPTPISSDAIYYRSNARFLLDGRGFLNPVTFTPSAAHPPAWSIALALPQGLGFDSQLSHQLFAGFVGTLSVILIALAARAVAGPRVGLVAAAIATVYPNLWLHERTLLSEVLVLPLVALAIWMAYRYLARPRAGLAAALGFLVGLLALTRPELVVLVAALLVPLVLLAGRSTVGLRRRLVWVLVGAGVTAATILPWTAYSSARSEHPVFLSTNFGSTAYVANCPGAYEGEHLGAINPKCWGDLYRRTTKGDGSSIDIKLRGLAIKYARDNLGRVPIVLAAREGRTWDVYRPFQQNHLDAQFDKTEVWVYDLALFSYWLLLPAAIAGVVVLRRRHVPVFVLLSFGVVVVIATAITLGQTRIRTPAEVPIVILAAVGIDAACRMMRHSR